MWKQEDTFTNTSTSAEATQSTHIGQETHDADITALK